MKKERTIIIKNPMLRNLRNNLRKIWVSAIWREVKRLKQIENSIEEKYEDPFTRDDYCENRAKMEELNELELNSIAYCQLCTSPKNDMVYIPENKAWYCVECQKKGVIVRLKDPFYDHIVP